MIGRRPDVFSGQKYHYHHHYHGSSTEAMQHAMEASLFSYAGYSVTTCFQVGDNGWATEKPWWTLVMYNVRGSD